MFSIFQFLALGLFLCQTGSAHPHHHSESWPWPPPPWTIPWWSIFPASPSSTRTAVSSTATTTLPSLSGPTPSFPSNTTSLASGPTTLRTLTTPFSISSTASPSLSGAPSSAAASSSSAAASSAAPSSAAASTAATSSAALSSAAASSSAVITESVSVVPLPSSTASSAPTTSTGASAGSGTYWKPTAGITWQIELSGVVNDTNADYEVFDFDLFDNPASTINTLHSLGKKAICYFSAGTYEDWRSDAKDFQKSDLGSEVDGWAGEWWVNTNSANVREIMTARIKLAASKGCDGVDPDNVDAYDNSNGLNLTQDDAKDYVKFLAGIAHPLGLAIGLKNAGDIVGSVLDIMEWQVNEQCVEYSECDLFTPFTQAGKPVFHIEYPGDAPQVNTSEKARYCKAPSGFSSVLKDLNLDVWIDPCSTD